MKKLKSLSNILSYNELSNEAKKPILIGRLLVIIEIVDDDPLFNQ